MLTNWTVSIWYEFLQKSFFSILIPIILRNMFKLYDKEIYTKYDKIYVFEKNPHVNYHREKNFWVEWSGSSLLFNKTCPDLPRFIKVHFSIFISPFLDISKPGNWWNSKFSKLSHVVHKQHLPRFMWHLGTTFSNGKNKAKSQGAWSMLQWAPLVHWGSDAIALSYPLFLVMILAQAFMLIKNHMKTWVSKSTENEVIHFQSSLFSSIQPSTLTVHQHCNWSLGLLVLLIVLWSVQVSSGSSIFASQAIQQPHPIR